MNPPRKEITILKKKVKEIKANTTAEDFKNEW